MKKSPILKSARGPKQKIAILFIALALIQTSRLYAQSNQGAVFHSNNDVFGTRCFIENKGQFTLPSGEKVLYAYDSGSEKIYFTANGLVYQLEKHEPLKEWQREAIEDGRNPKIKPTEKHYVNVEWLNSSPNKQLAVSNKLAHYFTYGAADLNASTYGKLVYQNVYPNIDIEYTLPNEHHHGIKYTFIVKPGADVSAIKIAYKGEVSKVKLDDNGEIRVSTPLEDIIEHAPVSYHDNQNPIVSKFSLKEKTISFKFPESYDPTKTLYIDPWVTTVTSLSANNYGYDVDYDFNGNLFVYGGYNAFKVAMYNALGTLVWTFAGTVTTPAWSSSPILSQASNFAVNKYNSKTYIGQGYVSNGNRVIRLDASGNYDNFINAANNQFQEVWDMGFHCVTADVFVLGGGTSSNISAVTINPTTAVITLSTFQPTVNTIAQDIVSHAIDDAGNIFVNYAGSNMNDKMARVSPGFNNNLWVVPSTFTVFTEQGNKSQYQWSGSLSSNGFNCLAVNANYLFYYDGLNLAAYNKTSGAIVANTTVSGLTLKRQGGIAVDDCNNLYLGGNGSILTFNFNGNAFSPLTPIPLSAATPSTFVYDLKLDKNNKILYTSGSGFVAVYPAAQSLACATASSACFFAIVQDKAICAGAAVTLSASNTSSLSNPSYSMQPGGLTNPNGTFVVSPTVTTTYTLYVTGTNLGNVVVTNSSVATVTVNAQPSAAPTTTQTTCTSTVNAFNLGLTFFPPSPVPNYSILWSTNPATLSSTQFSATGGINAGAYTATVTSAGGCSTIAQFTINPIPEPASFSLSPNPNYVLTCYDPVVTINYSPASLNYTTVSTSMAPVNGAQIAMTYSNAGSVVTVFSQHPISGCVSSQTYAVSNNTAVPTLTLSPVFQNITCSITSVISVTATGSPSVNIQQTWSSPFGGTLSVNAPVSTYPPGAPGVYTGCMKNLDNGCIACKNFTVTSTSGYPTFSVVSPQSFTLGCNTHSFAVVNIVGAQTTPTPGGAVTYTLLGPSSNTNYLPGPLSTFTVTTPGIYTVITKDFSNQCETSFPISILQNTVAPSVDVEVPISMLTCANPSVALTASTNAGNALYTWVYGAAPVVNLSAPVLTVGANFSIPNNTVTGTYTINIKNIGNDCIGTKSIVINQNLFTPLAAISGSNAISCNTPTITLTNQSTTKIPPALNPNQPVVATLWRGPTPQDPANLKTTYVGYVPGTYTMLVTDLNNGCTATATKTVEDARDYPPLKNPASAPVVLECGAKSATMTPDMPIQAGYTYSWTTTTEATVSTNGLPAFSANALGIYWVSVATTSNGCVSTGYIEIVKDSLQAAFVAEPITGFAPLAVSFTNTGKSLFNSLNPITTWQFGNGSVVTSTSAVQTASTMFTHAGT